MYKYLLILLVVLSACTKQEIALHSQIIKDWKFEYEEDWHKAIVPGNNFSDLLRHNFIINPFYGTNEDSVQWIARRDWLYKSEFLVTENTLKNVENINSVCLKAQGLLIIKCVGQMYDYPTYSTLRL